MSVVDRDGLERDGYEVREYTRVSQLDGKGRMGRVQDVLDCPFCNDRVRTYRWSRFGSGKRCRCGAMLAGLVAFRKKTDA